VACHSIVYVQFKVLLYLAIAQHSCPAGACQQSKHSIERPWLHSCHLKSCYDSLLVIVITRARTAETIYRSCYYPEQKISARKCTYNTYNFKTVKPSFVIASLPATQFRLPSMRWFGCDVSATHVALCPAAPAACVQQPRKLQQHLRRTFLAVWRSFCDTAH